MLQPAEGMKFESQKTYTHSEGLSCTFRQWRATHSHCRFLHGYALQVTIIFGSPRLDDRNWVMDFGGLKPIKQWLKDTFDHKLLVASDDPEVVQIMKLCGGTHSDGTSHDRVADVVIVGDVGCEAFAKMIYDHVMWWLTEEKIQYVFVESVTVSEHEGNSASYKRKASNEY